ncbi:MAG: gamma-glutamylcyclotransferase [Burkholderiaceae bacterium]|mgnify:CR=1 FL=1|nr:gamma-glutamylcyclotransferase [Burkholderiaceae bacterium]
MSTPAPSQTPPPASAFSRWSEEQRRASLDSTLALAGWHGEQDLWVFAYGSLIWRPEFDFAERRLARLHDHHRSLCLWSRVNRGTPEVPGLVFGLDHGGSCSGVVFRIPGRAVPETFSALWAREMSTGAYLPRWLTCDTDRGEISALAFVIDQSGSGYVPRLPEDDLVRIILRASGTYGPCIDYVLQTAEALKASGICDDHLDALARRLLSEHR